MVFRGFQDFLRGNARWLGGGFAIFLFSSFGQTFLISLSAGHIRREFELSHGAFGTLYMAAYWPAEGAMRLLWPGDRLDQSIGRFTEGERVKDYAAQASRLPVP